MAELIKVRLTTITSTLGTLPGDEELYANYIASKAPTEEKKQHDIDNYDVEEALEKGMTRFYQMADGTRCFQAYQIRGFFKGAAGYLRKVKGSKSEKLKAYKKAIDGNIYVFPEYIPIQTDRMVDVFQRPLRAETAQGARTALAMSEMIADGATCEFTVLAMEDNLMPYIIEWLNFGKLNGLGQWRNAGHGRFKYEILEERSLTLEEAMELDLN